jgi:hypothetical protein
VQDKDEVVQEWMLLPKGKQYGWMVLLDTRYQPVRLRLLVKSASQPEVFFLTENQPDQPKRTGWWMLVVVLDVGTEDLISMKKT